MHILDSDYIELESRRRAQLAALQWQNVTKTSKMELRLAHRKFLHKIYLITLLLIVLVATQWWFITELKSVKKFLIIYNYIILSIVFVHFLMLTLLQYVLRYKKERSKHAVIIYLFLMIEIGSITIARPTAEANLNTFLYALLFTLVMWSISFILAKIGQAVSDRSSMYLSLWSQKYYLASATSLLMTMEFNFMSVQISISLVMIFFISIFLIIWGRSLGSLKFYREESKYCNYYILLNFLNMISLLANSIIFFQRVINEDPDDIDG